MLVVKSTLKLFLGHFSGIYDFYSTEFGSHLQLFSSCSHVQSYTSVFGAVLIEAAFTLGACRKSLVILRLANEAVTEAQLSLTGYECKFKSIANTDDRLVFSFS